MLLKLYKCVLYTAVHYIVSRYVNNNYIIGLHANTEHAHYFDS